jgi:hypothetical protein
MAGISLARIGLLEVIRVARGTRLEQGLGRYRLTADSGNTESLSPRCGAIVNTGPAQTWRVVVSHTIWHKKQRLDESRRSSPIRASAPERGRCSPASVN